MKVSLILGTISFPEDKLDYGLYNFEIGSDVKYLSSIDLTTMKEGGLTNLMTIAYENIIKDKLAKNNRWIEDHRMYMEEGKGFVIVSITVCSVTVPRFEMDFVMNIDIDVSLEEAVIKWDNYIVEEIRKRANVIRKDYIKFTEQLNSTKCV